MPTLEVDGKVICQAGAIFRYVANELGLYWSTNMDRAIADQVCETVMKMFIKVSDIYLDFTKSDENKVSL